MFNQEFLYRSQYYNYAVVENRRRGKVLKLWISNTSSSRNIKY